MNKNVLKTWRQKTTGTNDEERSRAAEKEEEEEAVKVDSWNKNGK